MNKHPLPLIMCMAALLLAGAADAKAIARGKRSIGDVVGQLKPGDYVWAPELAAEGPALLAVNIKTQRAILFRNGTPIAASTVSTGKAGNDTPTGVFTILQKKKEHYSNLYNNAPMPNMQRLTWDGIALHAGKLPGYPASHGCIRLPAEFSTLLFAATQLGMTVVITNIPAVPKTSAAPDVAVAGSAMLERPLAAAAFEWNPKRAARGMVSVVISVADQRAIVLRGGVRIGSAPVRVRGPVHGAIAYVVRASDKGGRQWLKLQFSGSGQGMAVASGEAARFDTPADFRRALAGILTAGSVIIVTPESLMAGSPGKPLTVIENDVK